MEGLSLKTEQDLRIYCLTAHPDSEPGPHQGRFMFAYNLEEVQNAIIGKYAGRNVVIEVHGSVAAVSIMSQIAEKFPVKKDEEQVFKIPETPAMKRESFMHGLMLAADRFVEKEDSIVLKEIIKKIS